MSSVIVPATVRALAEADFSGIADCFAAAGFTVRLPARGILQIAAAGSPTHRKSVLISVGIHGDETGPIEMLAHLLDDLAATPQALGVDLMLVVGNLDAIAQCKRFVDADMNRMFRAERGELQSAVEAARADIVMRETAAFFENAGVERWHLDLHTAIRPSHYPTFAIVPELIADAPRKALIDWLAEAKIGAVIMNPKSAGTYSYYTSERFGAAGSTVELGRIGALGQNDLNLLAASSAALNRLIRCQPASVIDQQDTPHIFKVAQEIVKLSAAFRMAFDKTTQNFTAMQAGGVIASDGDTVYSVGAAEEFVVFPNPDVRVGQRAGLMVVRQE